MEVDSDDEELEEGVESDESCDLGYISGDVTHPQSTGEGDAIIVHCVGEWRRLRMQMAGRRLRTSISTVSLPCMIWHDPVQSYVEVLCIDKVDCI